MPITALPTPPSRSDPTNFAVRGDAFLGALQQFGTEANALAAAMNLNSTSDTSGSAVTLATGAANFVVSAGRSFQAGMYLMFADAAAPGTNSMFGQVVSYAGTALQVNIIGFRGVGTKSSWIISQSAPGGAAAGANSDITSLLGLTTPLSVAQGGTGGNTKSAAQLALGVGALDYSCNGFRLTLVPGNAVGPEVNSTSTIYWTPYKDDLVALYSGGSWFIYKSAQLSMTLAGLTPGLPYDIFAYVNAGVPAIERLAWTNGSTRATGLATQDGILVKAGDPTRRYIGSFVANSATTTSDTRYGRYLYNYSNRVLREMFRTYASPSWTYSSATIRIAQGSTSNQVQCLIGVVEEPVQGGILLYAQSSASVQNAFFGPALNSYTSFNMFGAAWNAVIALSPLYMTVHVTGHAVPVLGINTISSNEGCDTTATVTSLGSSGGIFGSLFC